MSWFHSLRKPAPSGTCDWWWIHSVAWTEATPLSLSALKKLHSRLWNWYDYDLSTIKTNAELLFFSTRHISHSFSLPPFSLQCNNNEIRPGKHIGVCISVANNRLFVGSIPKSKTKDQIIEEFSKVTGELAATVILCRLSYPAYLFALKFEHSLFVSKWWPYYYTGVTGFTMTVYR